MSVVEKLAYLKRTQRLTAEELSIASGVPLGTLNKILSGATKTPSYSNMYQISRALNTTLRYLVDDSIPTSCTQAAIAEHQGLLFLSDAESDFIMRYRALSEQNRNALQSMLDGLAAASQPVSAGCRKILCYTPLAVSSQGTYAGTMQYRYLTVTDSPALKQVDFCVQLSCRALEPGYSPNTVLGIRRIEPKEDQLGFFLYKDEGLIRRLSVRRGIQKLVATNVAYKDIIVQKGDDLRCLGTVVHALPHC